MSICRDKPNKVKCRNQILQVSICRDEPCKIEYSELNYYNCQYTETRQAC